MTMELIGRRMKQSVLFALALSLWVQGAFANPDLAVVKSGPATAGAGDLITYTLVYTNQGRLNDPGATLTDVLPPQLTADTNNLGGGNLNGNTLTWNLGSVHVGSGGKEIFKARISTGVTTGQSFTNLSYIVGTFGGDENFLNNTSRWVTVCTSCVTLALSPLTNQTVCSGDMATFSETVSGGTPPFSFQWYHNGAALLNATNSSLAIPNVTNANAGLYTIIVTGACGAPATNRATLTVNQNVIVTAPPANQFVCPNGTAVFTVGATGVNLVYQWYFNGGLLNGQTSNTLTLQNVTATNVGTYSIVVSSLCGNPATNSATLTINQPVSINTPPIDKTILAGSNVTFTVGAIGTSLTYQWYFNGAIMNSQTASNLTLLGVATNQAGNYCVVVSGACGGPFTNCANLTVLTSTSVLGPTNEAVCPGESASFNVTTIAAGLTYQWYFDVTNRLNSQINSNLVLNAVAFSNGGLYSVVVSGLASGPVTNSATLTVNTNASIVTPLSDISVCPGENAFFSVTAAGSDLTYQWYKGAGLLSGETGSSLTVSNATSISAGVYSVVVNGACGAPITNHATLTILTNVSVLPLSDVVRNIGGSVTFTATASGTGPFSYQWYKNGNPISGQTNSTLVLTNLQVGDAGTYTVSVTGACGQAATTSAVLIFNQPPTVQITYPTNGSVFVAPATFTITANAQDVDGTVTNVSFFSSTNAVDFSGIGQKATAPYFTVVSNLPVSQYTFTATAVDNLGATGVSAPVTVNVISQPLFTTSALYFGSDGYVHMNVVVSNTTPVSFAGFRIYISGITNPVTVANATGTTNGVPYIEWDSPLLSGATITNNIAFYVPVGGYTPHPTLQIVIIVPPQGGGSAVSGTPQAIKSGHFQGNGTFLVEFASLTNRTYYVQYSSNLLNWNTVLPSIKGNGTWIFWVDSGPPETISMPSLTGPVRYYRVVWVP